MQAKSDKDDLLKLILENKGIILKICNSYCQDNADREDLAQEIIIQLWKSGKGFNPDFKFTTWMYRVALNVAISFYRTGQKQKEVIPLAEGHLNIQDNLLEPFHLEEKSNRLQRHIAELKELDKALILLYFEEKSYKEIAEIVGITETNVSTKLSRIKEKLKQNIDQEKN